MERDPRRREGRRALVHGRGHRRSPSRSAPSSADGQVGDHAHLPHGRRSRARSRSSSPRSATARRARASKGTTATVLQGAARDTATVVGVDRRAGRRAAAGRLESLRHASHSRRAGVDLPRRRVARPRGRSRRRRVRCCSSPSTIAAFERGGPSHWEQHGRHARQRLPRHRGLRRRSRHAAAAESVAPQRARLRRRLLLRRPRRRRDLRRRRVDRLGARRGARAGAWKRFASGLYEPLNLKVVRDTIYVLDREGIVRLVDVNGDGEADSLRELQQRARPVGRVARVSARSRARSRAAASTSRSAARSTTGRRRRRRSRPASAPARRTAAPCRRSRPTVAASVHSRPVCASRTSAVDPRTGALASSDQQGNFVPATPVYLIREGGYYNVTPTAHGADTTSGAAAARLDPARGGRVRRGRGVGDRRPHGLRPRRARASLVRAARSLPRLRRQHAQRRAGRDRRRCRATYATPTLKGRDASARRPALSGGIPDLAVEREGRLEPRRACGRPGVRARFPPRCTPDSRASCCASRRRSTPRRRATPKRYSLESWHYKRTSAYGSGHFRRDGTRGPRSVERRAASLRRRSHACCSSCRRCSPSSRCSSTTT